MLNGKPFEQLYRRYLIDHSARRLNFLYWNSVEAKDATFHFVNKSGRELTTINNSDLIFRALRIKTVDDWKHLAEFIQQYLVDPNDAKATYVFRLDYLGTYLKSIGFDPTKMILRRNEFGTITADNDNKPLGTIDTDVHSLSLIDQLYHNHRKILYGDDPDYEISNIGQDFINDLKYQATLDNLRVRVPVTENLDAPGRKYLTEMLKQDPNSRLELLTKTNGLSTIVTRFIGAGVTIISTRVYLQYFLSKYKRVK